MVRQAEGFWRRGKADEVRSRNSPRASLELGADLHQPGLGPAVFERLFALLEVVAQTSQSEAVHGAIEEVSERSSEALISAEMTSLRWRWR